MQKLVAVIAETEHDTLTVPTLECVEEGRAAAAPLDMLVNVFLPGAANGSARLADELAAHGADVVTLVEDPELEQFSADGWLTALEPALRSADPALLLAPNSGHTRAWLPRLALRWQVPLVSGCLQVQAGADGTLLLTRPVYGGARHEELACTPGQRVFATLQPGVRGTTPIGETSQRQPAEVVHLTPQIEPTEWRDRTLGTLPADPRTVDLSEAERIVSGGLGVDGPEGVQQLQELADLLSAALGGTRVIADRGWLDANRFIGTTGKIVAPRLYIAFGVSGAGQHISGITESETVIVVNTDRTAPLFSIADLGVVGNLHGIVPALIERLRYRAAQEEAADAAVASTQQVA